MSVSDQVHDQPRPVGRPARINREMIAEAAHHVGLDGLTLRAVADELGVSIAALYHHVSSKEDLLGVAAQYSATRVPLPEDRGQHWAEWLMEWATYTHDVFRTQSGLLSQYVEAGLSPAAMIDTLDTIFALLVREGFSPLEASEAYELVSICSLGAAVNAIRIGSLERDGDWPAVYARVLEDRGPTELPSVRAFVAASDDRSRRTFHEQITRVLRVIAIERGEDWDAIAARLDAMASTQRDPATRDGDANR